MKHNVGSADQFVRFILTIVIGIIGIHFKSWWGLLAIVPFLTASVSFCPLYKIIGVSTCQKERIEL
ncbi:MAG TPA: DUF2892 domain-containing protein [Puia sp.]|nr:DUF2892 domain-containing protein [Puia sp.]